MDALVWALRHAADHDMDVEVLTVWPDDDSVLVHEVPGHFCAARWYARAAQEDALRQAIRQVPTPPSVTTTLENADVAEAIVRASKSHDLLVLGPGRARGSHRLTPRVVHGAACDVVVVGSSPPPTPHDRGAGPSSRRAAHHRQGAHP